MARRQLPEEAGEDADEALPVEAVRAAVARQRPRRRRMESQLRRLRVERVPRGDRVRAAGVAPRRQLQLAPAARRRAEGSRTGPAMERLHRDS